MENCDLSKERKIPQSDTLFFEIENKNWTYSIDICFDVTQPLDYFNLFSILKSYYYTQICRISGIRTCFCDINSNFKISHFESLTWLENLNFDEFINWINFRIRNDWKYNNELKFYSIRILFAKETVILRSKETSSEILTSLKPVYPWTNEWLNFLQTSSNEKTILKKKLEMLEKKIAKLTNQK